MCLLYTADIYVSFIQKSLEFKIFVSDSFRIPMELPNSVAGSSTLPHTSFMSGVRGASNMVWAMLARHRPNLATRDDTMTIIRYKHFHNIDSIYVDIRFSLRLTADIFRFQRSSWLSIWNFPFPRWTIFHVHALHLVGFDVEVLPATANESVLPVVLPQFILFHLCSRRVCSLFRLLRCCDYYLTHRHVQMLIAIEISRSCTTILRHISDILLQRPLSLLLNRCSNTMWLLFVVYSTSISSDH